MLELESPPNTHPDRRATEPDAAAHSNRRAHPRLPAHDLEWLKSTRVKIGSTISSISLIDLSPGGARFESHNPLKPGATASLTIVGRGIVETACFRVLRCEVSSLNGGLIYRGACEFDRTIRLPGSAAMEPQTAAPPIAAARRMEGLLERLGHDAANGSAAPADAAMLHEVNAALRRGDAPDALVGLIEAPLMDDGSNRRDPAPPLQAHVPAVWHKLVVRYLDGRLLKGFTQDFHPSRVNFHLWPGLGNPAMRPVLVPIARLKAVFFVRDFDGNAKRFETKEFVGAHAGRRIEITFLDDEVMRGSTLSYRPDRAGFFITPADTEGNNLRVFVVSSAVRHIRYVS